MRRAAWRTPHCVSASMCVHETPGLKAPESQELILTDYNYDDDFTSFLFNRYAT